jgi:hypothetical protein
MSRTDRISTTAHKVLNVVNNLSWSTARHSCSASRIEHTAKLGLHKGMTTVEVLRATQTLSMCDS